MAVNKITETKQSEIMNASAKSLPKNPSKDPGLNAETIQRKFYEPLGMIIEQINRVADEANSGLEGMKSGSITVGNAMNASNAITATSATNADTATWAMRAETYEQGADSDLIANTAYVRTAINTAINDVKEMIGNALTPYQKVHDGILPPNGQYVLENGYIYIIAPKSENTYTAITLTSKDASGSGVMWAIEYTHLVMIEDNIFMPSIANGTVSPYRRFNCSATVRSDGGGGCVIFRQSLGI